VGVPTREALEAGPRFELRAVQGDMLVRAQARRRGTVAHRVKEGGGDVPLQQPVAILREVVGDQIGSSSPNPTNPRNRRR
jgi:hypothetical protein